jgi:hypothetical protein
MYTRERLRKREKKRLSMNDLPEACVPGITICSFLCLHAGQCSTALSCRSVIICAIETGGFRQGWDMRIRYMTCVQMWLGNK